MIALENRFAQLGFWLLCAIGVFLWSGLLFFRGARETVLQISSLGWWVIVAVATCCGVLLAIGMALGSRSGSVDSGLVLLRKLRTGAWLLRVLTSSVLVALLVALFSWMWVQVAIRNLPAASRNVGGEVLEISRTSTVTLACRFHVHVLLDDGRVEKICAERGRINRTTPAWLLAVKEHDRVVITLRSNALGTSGALTASTGQ